jgi:hypothetical protein
MIKIGETKAARVQESAPVKLVPYGSGGMNQGLSRIHTLSDTRKTDDATIRIDPTGPEMDNVCVFLTSPLERPYAIKWIKVIIRIDERHELAGGTVEPLIPGVRYSQVCGLE